MADPSLRVGDWVEVRDAHEILATLDPLGSLDALPFMPEMLPSCGKRFQVVKTAHKTCDPTGATDLRHMKDAVHLETRCDGSAHGGCQAGCMFFWKTEWLKPVSGPATLNIEPSPPVAGEGEATVSIALEKTTRVITEGQREIRYRCQATELVRATTRIPSFGPMSFIRDITSGNVTLSELLRYLPLEILKTSKVALREARARIIALVSNPEKRASPTPKTDMEDLSLQPGEKVRVRPREEIEQTLNADSKNFGLSFDPDMRQFCGGTYPVMRRVERVINEKTGHMIHITRDCVILKNVICTGRDCRKRLFCSRSVYAYWREAWLTRA